MARNDTLKTKTCECGCGETVARRFRPGHDAKLKSRLVHDAQHAQWARRESAARNLVERGWGHFVPAAVLAAVPERSRCGRQFVDTLHVENLREVLNDQAGLAHSHAFCPEFAGSGTRVAPAQAGWLCSTCVHTSTLVERAARQRLGQWVLEGGEVR